MAKAKSARGSMVDFDLMKIKRDISAAPPPMDVRQRQDFIEQRLRRKRRVPTVAPKIEPVEVEPVVAEALIVPEPEMIEPTAEKAIEAIAEEKPKTKRAYTRKSTQKARPTSDTK